MPIVALFVHPNCRWLRKYWGYFGETGQKNDWQVRWKCSTPGRRGYFLGCSSLSARHCHRLRRNLVRLLPYRRRQLPRLKRVSYQLSQRRANCLLTAWWRHEFESYRRPWKTIPIQSGARSSSLRQGKWSNLYQLIKLLFNKDSEILTGSRSKCIDEIPYNQTANNTDNCSNRYGSSRLTKGYASNEYDGFHTFPEYSDKRKEEKNPFSSQSLIIDT